MTHRMKLRPEPFSVMKSGAKKYELRLFDEKRRLICPEDEIIFTETESGEELSVRVRATLPFESFEALYAALPLLEIGYTEKDVAEASYRDMDAYYPLEEQRAHGVLAIEIELI